VEPQLRREFTTGGERDFEVSGRADTALDEDGCADIGLRVDGWTVLVRPDGPDGGFAGCDAVRLSAGRHRLEGGDVVIDHFELRSGERRAAPDVATGAEVVSKGDGRRSYAVRADGPVALVSGDAYDGRWAAEAGGRSLGPPVMLDAQTAWVIAEPGTEVRIETRFPPARLFRAGLALSGFGVLTCLAVIVGALWRDRRR
jgi:hypothetical protein